MAKGKYEQWLTEDGLAKLKSWARAGLTDEQIAHNCGINRDTLKQWKKCYPAISATLKEGKEVVDIIVENALYKRALGYTFEEKTHERGVNSEGDVEMLLTKVVTKEIVADVTACIYWLKNRCRDKWKDNHDRAEIDRERLELDRRKIEADLKDKEGGDSTIHIILPPELEELAQ